MKTKKQVIISIIILSVVCLATVIFLHRPTSVVKEVVAMVYTNNGVEASETTISINGKMRSNPFSEEAIYTGLFQIAWYEPSCREGTEAKVKWIDSKNQYINFFQAGNISFLTVEKIIIDKHMEEIAVGFSDGTIITTSEYNYIKYKNSLSN